VFQLPIVLEILMALNIVKRRVLLKQGKYLVVLFFLLSALITPPDFITQVGLALPMTALFYLALFIARIFKFGEE
ncbi:MAG: twin-arginine translocase subunit TatC, partial [Spirochaetales bacterium]|nr:twin-arginine translocase subunit TatC [Spirochaetales bacterium]